MPRELREDSPTIIPTILITVTRAAPVAIQRTPTDETTVAKMGAITRPSPIPVIMRSRVMANPPGATDQEAVSYTHLRAHETKANLVCRLLLEKKKNKSRR